MDLLFKRYANPFPFLDNMLQINKFDEFVDEFYETVFNEKKEKYNWEFFLHRIIDKSYEEFLEQINVEQDNKNMSVTNIETTVQESKNILANFNPEERR